MKKQLVLASLLAGLMLSNQLSAAESRVVALAKSDLSQIDGNEVASQKDRLLLQDFLFRNFETLSPQTAGALEQLIGVTSRDSALSQPLEGSAPA